MHVPYSGAAPAVTDLLPGRVQMMFADIPVLLPHVLAGVLRPLAIGSAKRSSILPDVATFPELGLPGVEADNWYGFIIPAAAPAGVQAKLQAAAVKALRSPDVLKTLGALGVELPGNTPDEFKAYILGESAKWAEVVRISGAKIE